MFLTASPGIRCITVFAKQAFARPLHTTRLAMAPVKVGDALPNVDLFEDSPANKVNICDLSKGKKVIIFGVPGAFTPGCSQTHLPGYVENSAKLRNDGVNEIVCVSVNDPYVMSAWGAQHNTKDKVRMLADPNANFIKALDLGTNLPPLGGLRSKRFSMVINDCKVEELNVEPDGTGLSCSLADKIKIKNGSNEVDEWLDQNELGELKKLFRDHERKLRYALTLASESFNSDAIATQKPPSPRHVLTLALGHPSNRSGIIHIHNKQNELFFPNLLELHIHANQDTRQEESNESKLDGVTSFNYGVPMATFQLHHQTLVTIQYQSTRQEKSNEPKLDGVPSFNYRVPMATFQLHHQTLITIQYQSIRQDESNEPKLDGVASFNYGIPLATFQLHHQISSMS
ncbi:Peroxiredoxin-5, mitochondrial [Eumeta japonica]|uniref:Peroxiredoxin-5, mitochondrial n=1 Tax=Eumeta variegata TaxID=151549 RepID=A0A4C1WSC4_EUMVA|nr:Peroxiredoxin-5, mitochondrial [Eumeta japonica]